MVRDAASSSLSFSCSAASQTALPAITAPRLAKVPMPEAMASVSPCTTAISSGETCRTSPQI